MQSGKANYYKKKKILWSSIDSSVPLLRCTRTRSHALRFFSQRCSQTLAAPHAPGFGHRWRGPMAINGSHRRLLANASLGAANQAMSWR